MSGTEGVPLFQANAVAKTYPGVRALGGVDFDLRAGEVHALVGENGAGKSTLAQIIAGVQSPDSGDMHMNGHPYRPRGKAAAEDKGVRLVMQELNLIANLSIAENIFLRQLPRRFGFVKYRQLHREAGEIMKQLGLADVDPALPVGQLGVGRQQLVEIAAGLSSRSTSKGTSRPCRILVLDEPTASLTDQETELLFAQVDQLKTQGVAIIYISHRIDEVLNLADRVTVLRDGQGVATVSTRNLTADDVVRLMVGRDLDPLTIRPRAPTDRVALRVVGLTLGKKVKNADFEVCQGEILGVAGLMGSGRTEMMRAIFGADRPDSGKIYLRGTAEAAKIDSPRDAVRQGIALLTEDRKEQGLLLSLPLRMNVSLARLDDVSRGGWIDPRREGQVARRYVETLSIRCSSEEQQVGQLSGGNQQKVVIAKWLYRDCDVLIFDEPTRGIDIGARFEIYRLLGELAEQGKAIVFVSSDLKELMALCHRIMVLSAGRISATLDPKNWSEEAIMAAAFSEYLDAKEIPQR